MNNIYRENGNKVNVYANSNKDVMIKTTSLLYQDKFVGLGKTEKNVLFGMIRLMEDDMNTIQVGGDTLEQLCVDTGYSKQVIRNKLGSLYPLIEKTSLRGEYVINPLFAIKGNPDKVWKTYELIDKERR